MPWKSRYRLSICVFVLKEWRTNKVNLVHGKKYNPSSLQNKYTKKLIIKLLLADHLGIKPNWLLEWNDEQKFNSFDEIRWQTNFGIIDNLEIRW